VTAWTLGVEAPVYFILAGAVLGGLLQWLFLVPFARSAGMRFRPLLDLHDPDLREVGRLIVPRLFGVGVVQVNILVGRMLASQLGEGNVAALYFGSRITELTLGVFAISIATVVLPPLSRLGAAGDREGMRGTLSFALRQVTLITVPAAVGLIVLREPIIRVLFERGAFDAESTAMTAAGLAGYAVGLVGVAAVRIVAPGFYALRDTRTPVRVAAVAMLVNIVGCLVLRGPLQIAGIALASSIAGLFSAVVLLVLIRRRLGGIGGSELTASVLRVGVASALMAAVLIPGAGVWAPAAARGLAAAAGLAGLLALGMAVYFGALWALRAPELAELAAVARRQPPANLAGSTRSGSDDEVER
jgi:putative peptidoglycan lipid II flippase